MFKTLIYILFILFVSYLVLFNNDAKFIIAGISIFLIGMLFMEDGFKLFSGGLLEKILQKATSNVLKAIATGFITTSIMQSSSLLTIIIISFLSAELISLSSAIAVIFGANIGTTTTAWIVSSFGVKIQISNFAMPILILGVIFKFNKKQIYNGFGNILIGLGFVFLGISYMKEGFETMKAAYELSEFAMHGFLGILVYVFIGALATIILQSSSAAMTLIIIALATGQIEYINSLSLAIGANIGTTVTAIIASLSSNANGKRLALAHFIFNTTTALVAIIFLYQLIDLVDILSNMIGISSNDYAMKLALFHSIFNILGVLLVAPFTSKLVIYLKSTFYEPDDDISRAKYLDNVVVEVPEVAIKALKKEIIHLYDNATEVLSHGLSLHRHTFIGKGENISKTIEKSVTKIDINVDDRYEKKIKILYGDIINYSTLSQQDMSIEDKHKVYSLKIACRDIVETIKDVKELQKNINRYIKSKNNHIKSEYNFLREYIAKTLDGIEELRKHDDDIEVLVKIKVLQENLNKLDIISNGRIDKLIRSKFIETKMATSIINDSSYAYDISKKLIRVATLLWIQDKDIQDLGEG